MGKKVKKGVCSKMGRGGTGNRKEGGGEKTRECTVVTEPRRGGDQGAVKWGPSQSVPQGTDSERKPRKEKEKNTSGMKDVEDETKGTNKVTVTEKAELGEARRKNGINREKNGGQAF